MEYQRRAPTYFLVELSRRYSLRECEELEQSFNDFISCCNQDPQALETLWLSVITDGGAKGGPPPLTSVVEYASSRLFTNRESNEVAIAPLLSKAAEQMTEEILLRSITSKGDYSPLVVILLLGPPTDDANFLNALRQLSHHPTEPKVVMLVRSDQPMAHGLDGFLLEAPGFVEKFTGELLYKTWSYYQQPWGAFWESYLPDSSFLSHPVS